MKSYYDIVGDGGSDIVGQVEAQQERIVRSLSGVRNLVAVGSGKGGVGKSTLTMQLACALRASGHAVSILDADLNGPCQARLGGLKAWIPVPGERGVPLPKAPNGIGVVSMGSMVPEPRAVDFASVASGSSHTWRATREFTILRELLASMDWGALDFLLVDLPPGAERIVQYAELLGSSSLFILVTIPSDLSRGVVARSIDALANTPNRILGYIENMDGYYCADCGNVKPLFPASSKVKLDLACLGSVPFDPELAALCDRGGSLSDSPQSVSWQSVKRIVEKVVRAASAKALCSEEKA
ncbi:MAG: P-loop NTPase [Acidobacteria bacterium]|nr:P-loop NTPase [Acidobacteriota bacterium]